MPTQWPTSLRLDQEKEQAEVWTGKITAFVAHQLRTSAPDLSTPSENLKVNELNTSYDPTDCASSNYASSRTGETVKTAETGETFKTSYSKYGTRENREHVNSQNSTYNTKLFDDDTGKPILGSAYLQCKAARAASLFQQTRISQANADPKSGY